MFKVFFYISIFITHKLNYFDLEETLRKLGVFLLYTCTSQNLFVLLLKQ